VSKWLFLLKIEKKIKAVNLGILKVGAGLNGCIKKGVNKCRSSIHSASRSSLKRQASTTT